MPTNVKKGLRHTSSFSDRDCATLFLGSHAARAGSRHTISSEECPKLAVELLNSNRRSYAARARWTMRCLRSFRGSS